MFMPFVVNIDLSVGSLVKYPPKRLTPNTNSEVNLDKGLDFLLGTTALHDNMNDDDK